jgi:hypothetical protein
VGRFKRHTLFASLIALSSLSPLGPVSSSVASEERLGTPIRIPISNPTGRCCMGMDYDGSQDFFAMFGGRDDNGAQLDETWLGRWVTSTSFDWDQPTISGTVPDARQSTRMVWFGAEGDFVLFGGSDDNDVKLGDTQIGTRAGSVFSWSDETPAMSPTARSSQGMAYDPGNQQVVLFGGVGTNVDNTWVGDWNGSVFEWTEVCDGSVECGPSGLESPVIFYDADVGQIVMQGGKINSMTVSSATWVFTGTEWIDATGSGSPALYGHRMAYDDAANLFVIFGGTDDPSPSPPFEVLDDTHHGVWDAANSEYDWTLVTGLNPPSARCCGGMAYDRDRNELVYFGGADTNSDDLDDTWTYNADWECVRGFDCP